MGLITYYARTVMRIVRVVSDIKPNVMQPARVKTHTQMCSNMTGAILHAIVLSKVAAHGNESV